MNVIIHNESVKFIATSYGSATSGLYFVDEQKRYFLKKVFPHYVKKIEIERFFLQKLESYPCFPKFVVNGSDYIVTTYVGERVTSENAPSDYLVQVDKISTILAKEGIITDTKLEHFTVKNNLIYLVDFGEAEIIKARPTILNRIIPTHKLPPNILGYHVLQVSGVLKKNLSK